MTVKDLLDILQDTDPSLPVFMWVHACHRIPPSLATTVASADLLMGGQTRRVLLLADPCSHEQYLENVTREQALE